MKMPFMTNLISFNVLGFFMILWCHNLRKIPFHCLPVFRYRHKLGFLIYLHVANILELSFWCTHLFTVIHEEKHCLKKIFLFAGHLCCPLQMCVKVCEQTRVCDGWGQQVPFSPALSAAGGVRGWGSCTGWQQGLIWSEIFKKKLFSGRMENHPWHCSWQYIFCSLSIFAFICVLQCIGGCVLSLARGWHGCTLLPKKLSKVEIEKPAILMKAQGCKEGLPKPLLWIFWNQVSAAATFSYPFPPLQIITNSMIRTLNPLQLWHDPGPEFRVVVSHEMMSDWNQWKLNEDI